MAREIDRYFIVKVRNGGEMLRDSADTFHGLSKAIERAETLAGQGGYVQVCLVVTTERVNLCFEART